MVGPPDVSDGQVRQRLPMFGERTPSPPGTRVSPVPSSDVAGQPHKRTRAEAEPAAEQVAKAAQPATTTTPASPDPATAEPPAAPTEADADQATQSG